MSETCSVEYDGEVQTANDEVRRSSFLLNNSAIDVEKRAELIELANRISQQLISEARLGTHGQVSAWLKTFEAVDS